MATKLDPLRKELVFQLQGGNAHAPLEKVVAGLAPKYRGVVPDGLPYSCWQLLEHIRLAQADMLEFCTSSNYKEKQWPEDYWPKLAVPGPREWEDSIRRIESDRSDFIKLISDPKANLFQPLAWGTGQTLFHEACLIIDHNSYHLGEIVTIRRLLGAWPSQK